jgi:hypothetical protein
VTLGVERDESPVSLVVDGTARRRIDVADRIRVDVGATLSLVRPPGSADGARRLEKL